MALTWQIQTPTSSPGAVAVVQICGADGAEIDAALARLGLGSIPVGRVVVRDVCGVDRGLVARWAESSVHLMPHGGAAVIRALTAALIAAGFEEAKDPDPRAVYPEASSLIEARMLAALARAASPLAIDLLLAQPRRWEEQGAEAGGPNHDLQRLIEPPLVVAVGPPNIGKSSLVNALAGRRVSIVADEPGTTRDHVGVMIDMAGLVVRYVDTPGRRPAGWDVGEIEDEAARLADAVTARADLVLRCGDAGAAPLPAPPGARCLAVAMRADLGLPAWRHDAAVSALTGSGLRELAGLIRERLVGAAALADPRPWRFWA